MFSLPLAREGGGRECGRGETKTQREGGTEGEGGREILMAEEKKNFFYRPREREGGGREGGRGREKGTKGRGGERVCGREEWTGGGRERETDKDTERGRDGGREIITAEEKKYFFYRPERERVAEGRAGGEEREGRRDRGGERERGRE